MSKTNKSPAFQFYPKDYLSDINVQLMTLEERGAYLQLMCHEWEEKGLPTDDDDLSILSGLGDKWFEKSGDKIKKCFTIKKDKLIHPRLEKERKKQKTRRDVMAAASKKGVAARQRKRKEVKGREILDVPQGTPQDIPQDIPQGDGKVTSSTSSPSSSSSASTKEEDIKPSVPSDEGTTQKKELSKDIKLFFDAWNEVAKQSNLTSALELTPDRRGKIKTRLGERPLDGWKEIFNMAGKITFLNGVNQDGWQASFDWIIKNTGNGLQVLEGKYKKLMNNFITKESAEEIIKNKTGGSREKGLRRPESSEGSECNLADKKVNW
ncbi:DUF1376 domain-containing protein [Candidatus Pacearchaeota archaeon]|nr:DUF1376 domain-containing protein [Candidatus Pacearchaeota archaeon]